MRIRLTAAVAAVSVVMALAACSAGSPASNDGNSGSATTGCQKTGGTVTYGTVNPTQGFDPFTIIGSATTGGTEMTAVYDTLMRWDTKSQSYVPEVAESLTSDADKKVWTLKLRSGVTFGNGDPLTSDIVVANIKRMQQAKVASAATAKLITDIQAPDGMTVVMTLTSAWGDFPYLLASEGGMMVNLKLMDSVGKDKFGQLPAGGGVGPFEVTSFSPGAGATLTAKKNWWGGQICIDTLKFTSVKGSQATYDSIKTGDLSAGLVQDAPVLHQALDVDKASALIYAGTGEQFLINVSAGRPGANLKVRQAMQAAYDPQQINERARQGNGVTNYTVVGPNNGLYTNDFKALQPKRDLDKAKQLVQEAKADGWNGKFTLTYAATGQDIQDVALAFQAQTQAAGIQVTLKPLPSAQQLDAATKLDYDVITWGVSTIDASPWAKFASAYVSTSPTNRNGMSDPEFDADFLALQVASTKQEKVAALLQIQKHWNAKIPGLIYGETRQAITYDSKTIDGLLLSRDAVVYFNKVTLK